jgi:DNA-binding MarR family transcriptional regulator
MNMKLADSKQNQLIDRLLFLGQMSSTETALFHQKVAESMGLGITDMKTISVLIQEGLMTAGQLAKRLNLTTGAITNLLDRLERRSIVRRVADEKDRRKVIVQVDVDAIKKHGGTEAYESMGLAYRHSLAAYSEKELEFLVTYHESQLEVTKNEIAKIAE